MSKSKKPTPQLVRQVSPPAQHDLSSLIVATKTEERTVTHVGPLPAPDALRDYNAVLPGAAERIIAMAEKEADHRRQIDTKILDAQIADAVSARVQVKRGQYCGLSACLTVVVSACVVAAMGHEVAGSILGASGLAGIITSFVVERKQTKITEQPVPAAEAKP